MVEDEASVAQAIRTKLVKARDMMMPLLLLCDIVFFRVYFKF